VGVSDVLDFRKRAGFPDANHGASSVGFAIESFDGFESLWLTERDVNGREDSARDGEQVRGENQLRFGHASLFGDFGGVAMRKEIVGFEILVEFGEMEVAAHLFAGACRAGFAVGDYLRACSKQACVNERTNGEDNAGGVAAWVGDELCRGKFVCVKLGKTVDG